MVDGMKLAPILEDKNLIRKVLRHVVWWNFNLGPLRSVRLGNVEDLAARFGAILAVVAAEPGFVFIKANIWKRRGDAGREPVCTPSRRRSKWIKDCVHC